MYPDVIVDTKKKKGTKDIWPSEAQLFVISKVNTSRLLFLFSISHAIRCGEVKLDGEFKYYFLSA